MLIGPEFDRYFLEAIVALEPYLGDLVCIGGCANALYRHHEAATPTALATVGTMDLDLAAGPPIPLREGCAVVERLAKAGFREELLGTGTLPVVKFVPRDAALAAEIEFLCPSSGGPKRRGGGKMPSSLKLQDGLMGQPLQYLDILLQRPWRVEVRAVPGFETCASLSWVQVPNPAAYVVQKVLIRDQRRPPESMAKDCFYLFEIAVVFRDALDRLAEEYAELSGRFPRRWLQRFEGEARRLFADRDAEGAVAAMRVHRGISNLASTGWQPDEAVAAAAVAKMLERLFS